MTCKQIPKPILGVEDEATKTTRKENQEIYQLLTLIKMNVEAVENILLREKAVAEFEELDKKKSKRKQFHAKIVTKSPEKVPFVAIPQMHRWNTRYEKCNDKTWWSNHWVGCCNNYTKEQCGNECKCISANPNDYILDSEDYILEPEKKDSPKEPSVSPTVYSDIIENMVSFENMNVPDDYYCNGCMNNSKVESDHDQLCFGCTFEKKE
jgi:hypothetical protein